MIIKSKNILSVTYPMVNCYPSTSNALSILQSYPSTKKWLMCNFIQLFGTDEDTIDYFDFDTYNCPYLNYGEISFSVIEKISTYKDFIIEMINNLYYVSVYVETKWIDLYDHDMGMHQIFIYGYDLKKNVFYCADHFINNQYSYKECKIEKIIQAIENSRNAVKIGKEKGERFIEDYFCFQFYKYDDTRHKIKIKFLSSTDCNISKRIKQSVLDYLEGNVTQNWCTRMDDISEEEAKEHKWGINVYDILEKNLLYLKKYGKEKGFGLQSFYTVYNHKIIMKTRLQYLERNKICKNIDYTLLDELINLTSIMYKLYIKHFCVNNEKEKEGIVEHLFERVYTCKEKENLFFNLLYNKL